MTTVPVGPPPGDPDAPGTLPAVATPVLATSTADDRRRAAVVAVAVAGEAARRGSALPGDLLIWGLAGIGPPAGPSAESPAGGRAVG